MNHVARKAFMSREVGGPLRLWMRCWKCNNDFGLKDPKLPLLGARCPCGAWNNMLVPMYEAKESDNMAKNKGTVNAKQSGGATSFVLPVEKECGGSIKYGDPEGRATLPASNIYVSRRTWTNMPRKIKVTIEPVD